MNQERGPLTVLRNRSAAPAEGEVLSFLDDDVVPSLGWSAGVRKWLGFDSIGGVSGPAIIPHEVRQGRDLFKYPWIKRGYDWAFLGKARGIPGKITSAGTFTTASSEPSCHYEGAVDFMEACNLSLKTSLFQWLHGFDEAYTGVGEWSEPDLAFRLRSRTGKLIWFSPECAVTHYCDPTGAYQERLQVATRLTNYELFASRWVCPHWRHTLFRQFMGAYYWLKARRMV